ncbi:MAG: hypothetical protein GSR85_11845, partial [Desulfurococcales archaeon]|nr:hypothetical protein [Desulfurococcales archaeon]
VTRIAFKDLGILIGGSFLLLYGLVLSSSMITISLAKDKGQGILLILLIFLLLIVPLYFKKEFKFTSPLNTIVFIASIIDPIKYVTLGIIAYPIHYYIVFLVSGLIMFSLKVSRFGV